MTFEGCFPRLHHSEEAQALRVCVVGGEVWLAAQRVSKRDRSGKSISRAFAGALR